MLDGMKSALFGVIRNFKSTQLSSRLGVSTCVSSAMMDFIELWASIAQDAAFWNNKDHSCGVAHQISGILSSVVSREIKIKTDNKATADILDRLGGQSGLITEYITLFGGCFLRPVYSDGLQYELIPLGLYLPIEYDFSNNLKSAVVFKIYADGDSAKKFLLTEVHTYSAGRYNVTNRLFRCDSGFREVSLTDCNATKNITATYTWEGLDFPLFTEFRNNAPNLIDGSAVPVALINGAEMLIKDADEQYNRMLWEQAAGEMHVFADRSALEKREMKDGRAVGSRLSDTLNRLMIKIEGDVDTEQKITEHAPNLRTSAQNEMFQQVLRRIELSLALGKGTLSDMESAPQTATQYNGGRSVFFAIVDKIEDELEKKFNRAGWIFAYMAAAYKMGPFVPDVVIKWDDDRTRKDIIQAKQLALQEVAAGIMDKWEYRVQFFGESESDARDRIPKDNEPLAGDFGGM